MSLFSFTPRFRGLGSLPPTHRAKSPPRGAYGGKIHTVEPRQEPLSKADPLPAANYPVVAAADAHFTKVAAAFITLVESVKRGITIKSLADAYETRNLSEMYRALDLDIQFEKAAKGVGLQPTETSLLEALQAVYKAGAEAEVVALKNVDVQKATIGVELAFDLLNPEAVAWLSSYTYDLIREVSKESKLAIQDIIIDAFQKGGHPTVQAKRIKGFIGLTKKQAQAVKNFRQMLESGSPTQMQAILERALRDKRFDRSVINAINNVKALDQAKIDKMVEQYQARYLRYRAETIARTETIRASTAGQQNAWKQAEKQGLLKKDKTFQKWSVTKDDRLCPQCAAVPGLNPKLGVPLGESFKTPIGDSSGPPLHPNCRCIVILKFKKAKS